MSDIDVDDNNTSGKTKQSEAVIETPKNPAKRKASPAYNIRKRAATMHAGSRSGSKSNPPMSFSEMMLRTFNEAEFLNGLLPIFQNMMAPIIQTAVNAAVESTAGAMKTTVDKLAESTDALRETVGKQAELFTKQNAEIGRLSAMLEKKSDRINDLESKIKSLTNEIQAVKNANNDLEQYGRRNSIRISNLKVEPGLSETQLTRKVAAFLNDKLFAEEAEIDETHIERCHPVGPAGGRSADRPRQILVKFARYHEKQVVFGAKKLLKDNTDRVYISEDLTKHNYEIVRSLLPLKKAHKIKAFWTYNGVVYVKKNEDSPKVRLLSAADIDAKLGM